MKMPGSGLRIEQVALATSHRGWKLPQWYTHLRPEHLYRTDLHHTVRPCTGLRPNESV